MSTFFTFRRLALCVAAATLPVAAQANPMLPPTPPADAAAAPSAQGEAPAANAAPSTQPTASAKAQPIAPAALPVAAAMATDASGPTPLSVSAWGFSQSAPNGGAAAPQAASPGRPLYVWMTVDGGQAAIDRLQGGGKLAIQVHWTNDGANAHAPNLTSNLDIARPDIAPRLQGQVARTGRFEWHSWARKDSLSPGRWTVSLTDPSGQPLSCASGPCQMSIDVL